MRKTLGGLTQFLTNRLVSNLAINQCSVFVCLLTVRGDVLKRDDVLMQKNKYVLMFYINMLYCISKI